jgi:tetratricopeptide (TPR) repeat protein
MALANLAYTYVDMGRLAEAAETAEAAMTVIAEVGETYTHSVAMGARAQVYYRTGELAAAQRLLDRIVAVSSQIESVYPAVNARITLGMIEKQRGEYARALDQVNEAERIAREMSLPLVEADALTALASLQGSVGDLDSAREHAERALEIHTRSGHRLGRARTLVVLGRHDEAVEIFTDLGIPESCR